ncbi:histone-lysine N-methyltransferase 2D-like [Anarrhichthys ocellatus]|uniref:histone-lysine N-methyltransferase 2D-like n=1 Tax=Anarrhichthys ocellatus TaxID=433405 RepID=UPI0012ED7DAC|nr:histone-lysine N-methyltransferase 2D-like [Anarrhichthys ocellatus]
MQGSPISCSLAHSPHSPPCQAGLSPTLVQPWPGEPERSPPPHSPAQGGTTQTQCNRPCSPTDIITTQSQHSPPQRLHSPPQVDTSPPQSPTHNAGCTLDRESPGSTSPAGLQRGPAWDFCTLDQDLLPVCCRSTQTVRRHASMRPISAPCSPSPSPLRATQCSLSMPASPVQANSTKPFKPLHRSLLPVELATQSKITKECTKTSTTEMKSLEHSPIQLSPNLDCQTLESSPASDLSIMSPFVHGTDGKLTNQSSMLSSAHSSPHLGSAMPTPESLGHISTSMEHSSLTLPPCAHDSPSRYTEAVEGKASPILFQNSSASASPKHASQTPTSPISSSQACASPMSVETTETSPSTQPAIPGTLTDSYSAQTIAPLAPPVRSSTQPASPSAVLATSIHPISCQGTEIVDVDQNKHFIQSETSHGHPNFSLDSRVHTSPTHACPVSTEANSAYSLMDSTHVQERTGPFVCSSSELAQTHSSQSSKHPGQSNPSHVQTTCSPPSSRSPSPVQTSLLHTSFSPPHCRPTDFSPAGSSVSHSSSITDVNVSHSPLRSSPAGQAGPVHIQSTCSSAHSGPVQSWTPSLASTTSSSPAHATVSCVSPPHSPAQARYRSPHYSQAPDTGTSSGLTVAQLSPSLTSSGLDVDMLASCLKQSSVVPRVVQLDSGLVEPTDSIIQMSHTPASSLPDDSSAVSPNQASLSRVSQSPASPLPTPYRSAVKSQQNTAEGSPLFRRPASPVDATSALATPSHASPVHTSPTQDYTAMPSTSPISETPSQFSPPQTLSPCAPLASSVHSNPVSSLVCGPSPTSPVQPEASPSPGPGSPLRCEATPGPHSVSPVLATHGQSETSLSPGLTRPVQPDAGPGFGGPSVSSPQQHTTESESSVPVDVGEVEEQEKNTEEEKPDQTIKESPEDGGELDHEEEDQHSSSDCPPSGVQLGSVLNEDFIPPLSTPHSALPLSSPPRAGSLEVPPHRSALLPSCPPHALTPPSLPLEEESTYQSEALVEEAGLEDNSLFCHVTSADDDSQSQSPFEPAKDEHQSHAEPSGREEEPIATDVATSEEVAGQQPMREKQDAEEKEQGKDATGRMERESAEQEDQSDEEEEESVSPVLELDLDIEAMALMTSSSPPPSLLHLSSFSPPPFSHSRTLRPPPCSSRPSDDLSIRLRQSPFSTEASPETSPARSPVTLPPLSPPSTPLRYSPPDRESSPVSKAPPITVLPLTPKIGMGKPAISKRKFSPGRARVRQGSWWRSRRAVSPPSSSQDSIGEDSFTLRPPDPPLWSMKVGRGSGFPGRRRSRGGLGGGRGGRGRSRLKTQDCLTVSPGCVYVEPFQPKEEEENSMHNTVVMFSTSDHFTLRQDMCVVCGSFGQGAEGRLLACSQCGQCYHPYCVNVKITRVVLTKGWRCLECTVCETCGEASDPGRLLLCDDCDISYHTYCLDPPLQTVPKGAWKCKWCVWCVRCGSASPGLHCDWQHNYSRCGPCASLNRCPLCQRHYTQDELILQCQQCDRWVHAVCQGLNTEDEVEAFADEGFDCQLCQTHSRSCHGSSDRLETPFMAQIISRIREPEVKTYTQDGVCLTESGLSHLQSLVEPLTSPRSYRRCKPKLKLRIINQNSVSVMQTTPEPCKDPSRGDFECEMKSDSSPERDHDHDVTKESEVTECNKKRKRKPYRPGIGGFMVRQRGGKVGPSRIKLSRNDSTERILGDEGLPGADVSMETVLPAEQTMEKVKKRYRKKKTKLEEEFPCYLQEAFFGRVLLDVSRLADRKQGAETPGASQSEAATGDVKSPAPVLHGPSPSGLPLGTVATNAIKKQQLRHFQEERSLSPFGRTSSPSSSASSSSLVDITASSSSPVDITHYFFFFSCRYHCFFFFFFSCRYH